MGGRMVIGVDHDPQTYGAAGISDGEGQIPVIFRLCLSVPGSTAAKFPVIPPTIAS